ncbi:hypothetical protein HDU93_003060 [Gonapodya sp. JEL0774]|nr:hypothetical protein HDU93_003060 [Gonapodya sp. JEL0774]
MSNTSGAASASAYSRRPYALRSPVLLGPGSGAQGYSAEYGGGGASVGDLMDRMAAMRMGGGVGMLMGIGGMRDGENEYRLGREKEIERDRERDRDPYFFPDLPATPPPHEAIGDDVPRDGYGRDLWEMDRDRDKDRDRYKYALTREEVEELLTVPVGQASPGERGLGGGSGEVFGYGGAIWEGRSPVGVEGAYAGNGW